jgi:hypothetical protein
VRRHPAAFIEPCLVRSAEQPPEGRSRDQARRLPHHGPARRCRVQLLTRKGNDFSRRFPQIVAALTVLPVRSSQGRRLFCRFSDQTPALKCVMTDNLHRTCPHCGGKNTSYFIGIEESVWFTTKYETANGLVLFACSDTNRHKCPNLPKLEPAIAQHDNDTGGDALTP